MRRVLVVDQIDATAETLASKLGCTEIAVNVPRFEGYVKTTPAVVIESSTNPGLILGVFKADKIAKAELDALEDVPVSIPELRDPLQEIDALKSKLSAAGISV